jgi:hypothetical protein
MRRMVIELADGTMLQMFLLEWNGLENLREA